MSRAKGTLTHGPERLTIAGVRRQPARARPTCHTRRVNEVVPWSTRARDAFVALGSRGRDVAISGRDWFIDLGQGAWLLGLAVLVVLSLGVAIVVSHGDSGTNT